MLKGEFCSCSASLSHSLLRPPDWKTLTLVLTVNSLSRSKEALLELSRPRRNLPWHYSFLGGCPAGQSGLWGLL